MSGYFKLMHLADAYANAALDQGLEREIGDEKPELAREELKNEVLRVTSINADLLSALEGLLDFYATLGSQEDDEARRKATEIAKDAIEKAKGQS